MEITEEQFQRIEHCLPQQRGNVSMTNLQVLNAILYVAEHGCKWRGLPKRFGNWHTIYTRMNRWSKHGVLDRVFQELQREQIVRIKIEAVSLDSTVVKVHPDGTGAFKKNGPQAIGKSRGGWTTKIHMVAADARTALTFALSPGEAGDAPMGRALLQSLGSIDEPLHVLMDKAYEGDETRQLALDLGFIPVVPPKSNRLEPWAYDREMYKRRNEVERLFRRLKGFRRVFSRFDKLDIVFLGFVHFALIIDGLRW
ncbi:IS5 family transposase [Dyella caseinilytica]|uniref:IS5 family transposase n=1 Tax=Dyella caseinilytica TaxID=1849581 RepID=A0ABX7GNP9_9GAMM|nr:IS5 family transposase [Dyella caseinilytica]QRN52046.1 IS5 family transposase [Dyella caseinilytica]QRN52119.1 IS5 family transposase [Dyella caseinilytica]